MSFGGQDILVPVPPGVPAADVIIRLMRQMWPSACFQDAEEDEFDPIDSLKVIIRGNLSREFFVFTDADSALSWQRDGATPDNANSMLHFLIEPTAGTPGAVSSVTLVCDEVSTQIQGLVDDLRRSFSQNRLYRHLKRLRPAA